MQPKYVRHLPIRATCLCMAVVMSLPMSSDAAELKVPSPRDTVVQLYRDFSAQIVLEEPLQPGLWGQSLQVWGKYFSKQIVHLYAVTLRCADKHGICTTEVSPIWYSQDPGSVTVSVKPGPVESIVIATIEYPKDAVGSGTAKLEYRLVRDGDRWKIADIAYPDGTTLKGWLEDAVK